MEKRARLPQLDGVRLLAQLWILCAENLFLGYKVRSTQLHVPVVCRVGDLGKLETAGSSLCQITPASPRYVEM